MAVAFVVVALAAGGCGGGDRTANTDSPSPRGFDDRKIAKALDLRFEPERSNALIYEPSPGQRCRVIDIPQTETDVRRVLETSENAPDSLATTPDGGAGVEFVGAFGGSPPEYCVPAAEADLAAMAEAS